MPEQVFDLLRSRIRTPLVLIDVGARWGSVDLWGQFGDKARIICFEADEEETKRLTAENKNPNIEYAPFALSYDDRGLELTITEGVGCSSAYPPRQKLYDKYPGLNIMRPVRTVKCRSTSLDEFLAARQISRVDAIKLDTQGSELAILKGAEKALDGCGLVIVEVEFNAMYEGQPLFGDVDRFMRERGFVLWRFNNLAHYSTGIVGGEPNSLLLSAEPGGFQYVPVENGQLFWADAFYVKEHATPVSDRPLGYDQAVGGAVLAAQWKLWDLALEMIRKAGDPELISMAETLISSAPPLATLPYQIDFLRTRVRDLEEELARIRKERSGWLGSVLRPGR